MLHRLALLSVNLLDNHLWLSHLKLIALATHGLDKHRQVKHSTPKHIPRIFALGAFHSQRKVLVELAGEAVGYVARCHIFSVFSEEWRVVDGECHRHGRLVDGDAWQRFGIVQVGNGVANLKSFNAYKSTDITRLHALHLFAAHSLKHVQLLDALLHG